MRFCRFTIPDSWLRFGKIELQAHMNHEMFAMLNGWEILLILLGILILFGAKKLPELARGLGQGIREFKKSTREVQDELESALDLDAPPATSTSGEKDSHRDPS